MSRVYVYALISTSLPRIRVGGERLECIPLDGVYAVASRQEARPVVSEEALRHQHRVVEQIASRAEAVLPARFGSLVDLDELRQVVRRRADAIHEALNLVRHRCQMTARVIAPEGHEPARPRRASTGTEYLRARRVVPAEASAAVEALRLAVRDLVAAERVERGRGAALATVYHLLAPGDEAAYRQRVEAASGAMPGLAVRVSGPWPPFAFAPELLA